MLARFSFTDALHLGFDAGLFRHISRIAGQSALMMRRLESAKRRFTMAGKQYCQIKKLLPGENRQPDLRIFRPRQDYA